MAEPLSFLGQSGPLLAPAMPDPFYAQPAEVAQPWMIPQAIARDPRVLVKGGRVLPKNPAAGAGRRAESRSSSAEVPFRPSAPAVNADLATLLQAETWQPVPTNIGTAVDLDAAPLDPRTAAIGDLLSRSGQARERGRQAGQSVSGAGAFGTGVQAGANLNLGDEIAGLTSASGLPGWTPPMIAAAVGGGRIGLDALGVTSGDATRRYADQRDYARGYGEAALEGAPLASLAGQIAGGLTLPVGAAGAAGSVGRGLATGAGYGALSGLGSGEGLADRAFNAGVGGTLGGTLGAGLAGLAGRSAGRLGGPPPAPRTAAPVARISEPPPSAIPPRSFDMPAIPEAPTFVSGPYGKAQALSADEGMEAIRAGIMRNLQDPSLARPTGAPVDAPDLGMTFGPYGRDASTGIEAAMDAIRAGVLPSAPARVAPRPVPFPERAPLAALGQAFYALPAR